MEQAESAKPTNLEPPSGVLLPDPQELQLLCQSINMGLTKGYLDGSLKILYINERALDYFECTRQQLQAEHGSSLTAFIDPSDVGQLRLLIRQLVTSNKPLHFQIRAVSRSGRRMTLQVNASCHTDGQGRICGMFAFQDITRVLASQAHLESSVQAKIAQLEQTIEAERQSREALRVSEARYRLVVELSEDIVFEWDFETDTAQFSDKYEARFGEKAVSEDIRKNPQLRQRLHPEDLPDFEHWLCAVWRSTEVTQGEFRFLTCSGNFVWVRARTTPILSNDGRPLRALGILSDITALKCEMDALTRKSQQDPLTKLLNKEETHCRIARALAESKGEAAAFFVIDVDNFKQINDCLGHQFGDMVLLEVSRKIAAMFRDGDIAGRLGGDEFAVFMQGIRDIRAVHTRAAQLIRALNCTYGDQCAVSSSIGIALAPTHAKTFEGLYRLADLAMYTAKRTGKDRYAIYNPRMEAPFPAAESDTC